MRNRDGMETAIGAAASVESCWETVQTTENKSCDPPIEPEGTSLIRPATIEDEPIVVTVVTYMALTPWIWTDRELAAVMLTVNDATCDAAFKATGNEKDSPANSKRCGREIESRGDVCRTTGAGLSGAEPPYSGLDIASNVA